MAEPCSIVLIIRNEAENLPRCLASCRWADEIVVLDTGSTDNSEEIVRNFGGKFIYSDWQGFGLTKQKAVALASHDWIFSIDADEEVSPGLAARILNILQQPDPQVAWRFRRRTWYLNRFIRYSGWQKDFPLRLFNRRFGNFNDKPVHESVQFGGSKQFADEILYHYSYPTLESHLLKMDKYSTIAAQTYNGRRISVVQAVFSGWFKFMRMFILQLGFLDGRAGFILAKNSAFGVYLKYMKIWLRQNSASCTSTR